MSTTLRTVSLAIICCTIVYSCKTLKPQAPGLPDIEIPEIEQPVSEIEVPITLDLKKYFTKAETKTPHEYSDSINPCQGVRYYYLFKRPEFGINGEGKKVNLSVQGEYKVDMSYCVSCFHNTCISPIVSASCGVGEPMRKINIGYTSVFTISHNYQLTSKTSLVTLEPINKCTVSLLNVDVTDRLIGFIKEPLNNISAKVDERMAKVDLQARVERIWNRLSSEIELNNQGYIYFNPQELSLRSWEINGSVLKMNVNVAARPVISTDTLPHSIKPLPNLSDFDKEGNGFNVYFKVLVSYDSLTANLNREIVGQTIKVKRRKFIITKSKVYGIGNQRIVVEVEFKGNKRGKIYLTGTPSLDSTKQILNFSDLEFDLKSSNPLLRLAKWLFNDKIASKIQEKASYDLGDVLNDAKKKIQKSINRSLGGHAVTKGEIGDIQIHDIYPTKSAIVLRTFAKGTLEVEVREEE